jgi:hypothetical protein
MDNVSQTTFLEDSPQCCGAARLENFCPVCGRPLHDSPLVGLLIHCLKILSAQKRLADRARAVLENGATDQMNKKLRHYETALQTWERRIDALAELMLPEHVNQARRRELAKSNGAETKPSNVRADQAESEAK